MTKKEFEERTGLALTDDEYATINWMYVNADNMHTDEFCEEYKEHSNSKLLKACMKHSEELENELCNAKSQFLELAYYLVDQAEKCSSPELRLKAIEVLGMRKYLRVKIQKGYSIWREDRLDLLTILNEK